MHIQLEIYKANILYSPRYIELNIIGSDMSITYNAWHEFLKKDCDIIIFILYTYNINNHTIGKIQFKWLFKNEQFIDM